MFPNAFAQEAVTHEINVVPMNFRKDFVPRKDEPGEFKEVHKVDLVKKGSNGESTPWEIGRLQKDQILWPYIKPFYERWLEGQEDPVEGTPIDCLPFLPPGLVGHLRNLHIRSAEDLASVTDADLDRIGMGARGWREKARNYVEAKSGDARLAAVNADLQAEKERMQAEIDELKALVNSLTPEEKKTRK